MRWWPPLLHVALIAVLLPLAWLRIGYALDDAPATEADFVAPRSIPAAADIPVAERPADLDGLLDRPVFGPDRRRSAPVPEIAPPVENVTDRAADLRMVGYLNDGTQSRAIVTLSSTGAQATVREGDDFEGFKVRSITPSSVVVTNRGKETTIKMFDE